MPTLDVVVLFVVNLVEFLEINLIFSRLSQDSIPKAQSFFEIQDTDKLLKHFCLGIINLFIYY